MEVKNGTLFGVTQHEGYKDQHYVCFHTSQACLYHHGKQKILFEQFYLFYQLYNGLYRFLVHYCYCVNRNICSYFIIFQCFIICMILFFSHISYLGLISMYDDFFPPLIIVYLIPQARWMGMPPSGVLICPVGRVLFGWSVLCMRLNLPQRGHLPLKGSVWSPTACCLSLLKFPPTTLSATSR